MILHRNLQDQIEKWFFKGKIIILYGARQVGKTTLVRSILQKYGQEQNYFNCEIIQVQQALSKQDPLELRKFLGNGKIIVLDEAQKIHNVGLNLKLLIDTYPDMQIIATGSSSFDLSNKINEPLTGRALEFILYPFSISELSQIYKKWELEKSQLENFLRFGLYPEVALGDQKNAQIYLDNLAGKYLYRDILEFENLKRSDMLINLLQLLALQIGQEVSFHELAITLQCTRETVKRYLDLLEKSFVIYKLRSFSRNLRKEIGKKQKIYFYDLGIRNSLIGRYAPLSLRDDTGALWENFCVIERMKHLQDIGGYGNRWFWRTHDQKEIDYIEEYEGKLHGYEFKWGRRRYRPPAKFLQTYAGSSIRIINKDNFWEFLAQ